jgi:hypothetical protein
MMFSPVIEVPDLDEQTPVDPIDENYARRRSIAEVFVRVLSAGEMGVTYDPARVEQARRALRNVSDESLGTVMMLATCWDLPSVVAATDREWHRRRFGEQP